MLTGVERGERSDAVKVTAIFRQSVTEKVIIEGIRRRGQQVGGDEAGPALLDGPAIAFPGAAGPVQRGLDGRVLGVVLRHAPELHRRRLAVGGGGGGP